MISSGDRTTILLRQDGKLYVWGSNYQHFINDTDNGGVDYNEVQDLSKL
jgi:alpha-tubulin suppressor-like RCC1 family protein